MEKLSASLIFVPDLSTTIPKEIPILHEVEPHYGWLKYYSAEADPRSPFHHEEHNEFFYDRQVYQYLAHPQWDVIGSDGLLVKVIFADYDREFAIVELFGVWNDLLENDFKLLVDNCLSVLVENGVKRFVLILENVLNIYLDADDYYEAFEEELEGGWICLLKGREHVLREIEDNELSSYFYWSPELDGLLWRKLKPVQLFQLVEEKMRLVLGE